MDATTRRLLILSGLLLATLAALISQGRLLPDLSSAKALDPARFTLDRGGIIRFNNGKVDVRSAFIYNLADGPAQLPRQIGRWEGVDFPLNLEAYTSVSPELMINRAYRNSRGENVSFTIIGSDTSRKLHRPEICYRAGGWTVTELPVHTISLDNGQIAINQFIARNDALSDNRLVFSWYLWRDDRRRIEDGAYVMHVTSSLTSQTQEEAVASMDSFIRQILPGATSSNKLALQLPWPFAN
ncbi:MAG: EpsI family protein [Chloroflexi bacterium]|nr:EpsI family protein [Chloroflexota bacterium]